MIGGSWVKVPSEQEQEQEHAIIVSFLVSWSVVGIPSDWDLCSSYSRTIDDNDGAAHEAASTETVCLSAGMLVSADEVSQTDVVEKDKRAETVSRSIFSSSKVESGPNR